MSAAFVGPRQSGTLQETVWLLQLTPPHMEVNSRLESMAVPIFPTSGLHRFAATRSYPMSNPYRLAVGAIRARYVDCRTDWVIAGVSRQGGLWNPWSQ